MSKLNSILVVDDNPENIKVLGALLEKIGYEIRVAINGKGALEVISASKPDLILLDIMMPDMSGYEVCQKIKSDETTKDIPIIFISALHSTEDKIKAFSVGGVDYITKPFEVEEVKVRVSTHLELSKKREELLSLNRDLQKRVEEEVENRLKSIKSYEQILIQQSKMAEMGEMIGAIAHQWKQPLNLIGIYAQDLTLQFEDGELNEKELEKFEHKILEQIDYMAQTIDDFKNFFKPSKEKKEFLISKAILEVNRLLEAKMKKHDIKLTIDTKRDFEVVGYPNEFKQVILNIINNAVDKIDENRVVEGEIKIFIDSGDKEGTISIIDNGGGVPKELLPDKIFEAYITTKGDLGTGMGLQIAKTIIEENMDGKISAKNRVDGAEFKIELPIYLN